MTYSWWRKQDKGLTNGPHHHDRKKRGRSHASSRQYAVIRRWSANSARTRAAVGNDCKHPCGRVQRAMLTTVMSLDPAAVLLFLITAVMFIAIVIEWMGS
jgi:hypothetical protein